jgi:MoaA/NifB/PqqE/SkfB family radical SAM enzyme
MVCAIRFSPAGVHLFDRLTGLNVLVDEVDVADSEISVAPRYLSIALTNACELRCRYCYAPKHPATLDASRVVAWAVEVNRAGCLGIGFGGGEPTAHPRFTQICRRIAATTTMAVTFTTHGHRITPERVDALHGSVHFARLSVDGVGATYERLRGRPFAAVTRAALLLRSIAPLGVNTVVNADTVGQLDSVARFAVDVGASELLLLPEQPTAATPGISPTDALRLVRWIRQSAHPLRLAISRSGLEEDAGGVDLIPGERPMEGHLHVDATGVLRPDAYATTGVAVEGDIIGAVRALWEAA